MSGEDNGRRAVLSADEDSGFAVWITRPQEPEPPLPAGVSHLLAADDALIVGRWGAHITLCGLQVRPRGLSVIAVPDDDGGDDDDLDHALRFDSFRYCPECVAEAARWSAEVATSATGR